MPVVYAAVGRRLGYPVKLVTAKGSDATHVFCRWESASECFNIEASAPGLSCFDLDFYRTGRYALSPEHEAKGAFLRSKTPREELAFFLAERFVCWKELGNRRRAAEAMAWAAALAPDNTFYLATLKTALTEWLRQVRRDQPAGFPELLIKSPQRRFPPPFPLEVERDILGLEASDNLLRTAELETKCWQLLRQGVQPPGFPMKALVDFTAQGCNIHLEPIDRGGNGNAPNPYFA